MTLSATHVDGDPADAGSPSRPDPQPSRAGGRIARVFLRRPNVWDLISLVALTFMAIAFVWPLLTVIQKSLEPSPGNFIDVVTEPGFVDAVLRTLKICVMSTAIAVLLGYPFAYAMAAGGRLIRIVLVASLLMTTWTSLLIRTYAITILFDDNGVLNNLLTSTNIIDDPLPLTRNQFAVTAATVQILLPFVILPIFLRLRSFDPQLVEAAASLGGRRVSVFWRVILPLTIPSVAAGAILGFILSVGFFIVAQLVGSPGDYLVSQGVAEQINSYFAPNVAAAMSAVLLLIVIAFLLLIYALLRIGKFGGVSEMWSDNK